MRIESWVGVTAVLLLVLGGVVSAAQQQCLRSPLPTNVYLVHDIERAIQRIYDLSPSFRAQCERIAGADNLRVTVRIDPLIQQSRRRAFTLLQRRGRQIRADVHLPPSSNHAEMLAHEFEHIVEQIEGLDLRTLARVKESGVHEVEYQVFESDRAQAAGRVVKAEATRAPTAD